MGGDFETLDYNYFVNSMVEDHAKTSIIDESEKESLLPNLPLQHPQISLQLESPSCPHYRTTSTIHEG